MEEEARTQGFVRRKWLETADLVFGTSSDSYCKTKCWQLIDSKSICSNFKMYLLKLQTVFFKTTNGKKQQTWSLKRCRRAIVKLNAALWQLIDSKPSCLNFKMYLWKLQKIFFKTTNWKKQQTWSLERRPTAIVKQNADNWLIQKVFVQFQNIFVQISKKIKITKKQQTWSLLRCRPAIVKLNAAFWQLIDSK